jgi:DNA-directed RNA polymerase subunit omega
LLPYRQPSGKFIEERKMARITVEDCLKKVNNRFTVIHMAAKRVRQLRKGAESTIRSKNKDIVVSLREIAAGNVIIGEPGAENYFLETGATLLPEVENPDAPDTGAEEKEK